MKNKQTHNHRSLIQAAKTKMVSDDAVTAMAETFKVLSDPTRLKIVLALTSNELCVFDIAQVVGISESAASHQLRVLKPLRLVKQRKEGTMVYYSLDDEHIEDLIRVAGRHVSE